MNGAKFHGIKTLSEKYAEKHGTTLKCAEERVKEMVELLEDGIADPNYDGIQFINSLTFRKVVRKAKVGRNPRNGVEVPIPQRLGIKTEIGKNFATRLEA